MKKVQIAGMILGIGLLLGTAVSAGGITALGETGETTAQGTLEAAEESSQGQADGGSVDGGSADGSSGETDSQPHGGAQETAIEGIYIENINVAGMNQAEIEAAVQQRLQELSAVPIDLYVGNAKTTVTAGELGLTWTNTGVVRQALDAGQKGNVFQRFQTRREIEKKGPKVYTLQYGVDEALVRAVIEGPCAALNHGAVNRGLQYNGDGTFTVLEGSDGAEVNVEAAVGTVTRFFSEEWRGGTAQITLDVNVVAAQGDAEQLSLVKDVLGESSTDYSSSSSSRRQNIETGVAKLNGKVIYPGEEFSVCDNVVPFNAENGYAPAPSYEMGSVVDSYGGGICQVSTTLYLAVLRAELEVTERYNHSMIVNYVKPSMDAAIAEGYKDFKFRNNTDAPIYILGYASGGEVGFVIYGHETRDRENRKVTYESETISETPIEEKIQTDSSLEFGQTKKSSGHVGKEARLWKIVTVNGQEESREQVNSSVYNMSSNLTKVGTAGGDEQAVAALEAAAATNDINQVNAVLSQYPGGKTPVSQPQTADGNAGQANTESGGQASGQENSPGAAADGGQTPETEGQGGNAPAENQGEAGEDG